MTSVGDIADQIGIPLTGNSTEVLLLGAGEMGKQLVIACQNLGLKVHVVDRYAGAPAYQLALATSQTLEIQGVVAFRANQAGLRGV